MSHLSLILLLSLLYVGKAWAQESILVKYGLPEYNCDDSYYRNYFIDINKVVVIPSDTTGLGKFISLTIESFSTQKGNNEYIIKRENEFNEVDLTDNAVLFIGVIGKFRDWDRFGLPIKQIAGGFSIQDHEFTDPGDGFTFITDTLTRPARVVISGNSPRAVINTNLINFPIFPGFNFAANNGGRPTFFGNYPGSIKNMDNVKNDHYKVVETEYYRFHISKNLAMPERAGLIDSLARFDSHVERFIAKLELDTPAEKIDAYIHSDWTEISYACGLYIGHCLGSVWGFSNGGEIHSYQGTGTIPHESNHYLFAQVREDAPVFLLEGIQKWYENSITPGALEQAKQVAIKFTEEDLTDMITTGEGFFTYDNKYYTLSGVFVDYLIELYGLDKFKELYSIDPLHALQAYEKTYGIPLDGILTGYRSWLLNDRQN